MDSYSEWVCNMFKQRQPKSNAVITAFAIFVTLVFSPSISAQEDSHAWEGQWAANGTYFKIAVTVEDNV
ncbi:MAG: hypothetical protein ACI945_002407, partial [Pseudohongiellaceae bacterium]